MRIGKDLREIIDGRTWNAFGVERRQPLGGCPRGKDRLEDSGKLVLIFGAQKLGGETRIIGLVGTPNN